jgi:two-component system, chemotaxis family, chemotaxis protein CheY
MLPDEAKKYTYLIVDDMYSARLSLKATLEELGAENIIEAEDGQEAYDFLQKQRNSLENQVDFIISDLNMPNMTGLDLIAKLREDQDFRNIHFLLLTAETEAGKLMVAVKQGINNFLYKPYGKEDILEKIIKVVNKSRNRAK